MTRMRSGIQLALALFSAPLLAADAPGSASATTLVYACDEGKQITSVIDDSDPDQSKITVSVAGDPALQNVEMHYQMSANGEKAGNGKLVWWTKGDEGFLAQEDPPAGSGDVIIGGCREVPATR
ncbi:MAG: MliC family protein [Rhodanobacteraceae bacterium]|nr:MliC family protein [Rhodanobacteraceae bacterium]